MPSDTMSAPSSGSMTVASTAITSSRLGAGALSSVAWSWNAFMDAILPARAVLSPASGYSGAVGSDPGAPPTADRATVDRPSDETILPSRDFLPSRDILKVLGDNTRYAIYLELARAARPLVTAEIAETLGLHPNTVRPHLDRMREVGLLDVTTGARGEVGRPQHRYSLAADAPAFGLEPPTVPVLARMVLNMAERLQRQRCRCRGGRGEPKERRARPRTSMPRRRLEALVADLDRLGFDPVVAEGDDPDDAVVAFANCPFSAYTETHQDLVCGLHRVWSRDSSTRWATPRSWSSVRWCTARRAKSRSPLEFHIDAGRYRLDHSRSTDQPDQQGDCT